MTRRTSHAHCAPEPEPTRWVMVGWRSAEKLPASPTPAERTAAFLDNPQGPCARCGATCHRYGPGGNPLCSNCHR